MATFWKVAITEIDNYFDELGFYLFRSLEILLFEYCGDIWSFKVIFPSFPQFISASVAPDFYFILLRLRFLLPGYVCMICFVSYNLPTYYSLWFFICHFVSWCPFCSNFALSIYFSPFFVMIYLMQASTYWIKILWMCIRNNQLNLSSRLIF